LKPALAALARPSSFDLARRVVFGVPMTDARGERLRDYRVELRHCAPAEMIESAIVLD
jgi:hypothetical protein